MYRIIAKGFAKQGARYHTLNLITLHRQCLLANVRLIQQQHPGMKVIPVLKGNAYGHGLAQVTAILNDADIEMVAVDGYFEAGTIRHITKHKILVMGYILPENVRLLDTRRCSFVVQDVAGLEAFGRLKRTVRIHLELNTGMNRLGLAPDELAEYVKTLKRFPNLQLEGVMSHLADADNEADDDFTKAQTTAFDVQVQRIMTAGFRPKLIHLAQTAGSTKAHSQFANSLRIGIGTYGVNPLGAHDRQRRELKGLQPILELTSAIVKTIDLKKGDRVSYSGIFVAPMNMRIGVLPLGYYEGVPRALSNVGVVTHGKEVLPIVGRVCMNHTMIDLQGSRLRVGDEVTVISSEPTAPNSIAGLSAAHDLFPYTTMTSLSPTIRRVIG